MGVGHAAQPMRGKEVVRPALMVGPSASASFALAVPEGAPKTHPYPGVQGGKRGAVAVLEVFKPAPKRPIHVRDDREEAFAGGPARRGTDRLFELGQTLRSGAASAVREVVA